MYYGLNIQSEIPLFDHSRHPVNSKFDVTIYLDSQLEAPCNEAQVNSQEATIYLRDVGVFRITQGKQIGVNVSEGTGCQEVARILLGIPMGYLLYQRGFYVLHASVVNIFGQAAAFVGLSGSGKSTCAASFINFGHSILSEDIAAIDLSKNSSTVSGLPWLKIGLDVWEHLNLPKRNLVSSSTDSRKRFLYMLDERQFCTKPVRLKNCYLLEWGEHLKIEAVTAQQSFVHIFPHTFHPIDSSGSIKDDAHSFRSMIDFCNQVSVYRLTRPKSLERLDECRILVEEHMKQSQSSSESATEAGREWMRSRKIN